MRRRGLNINKGGLPVPTSEYKLEETSGTIVNDTAGTNNATISDVSAVTAIGKTGNGFSFNSPERNIVAPYSSDFIIRDGGGNKPFSLCFWDKLTLGSSVRVFARLESGVSNITMRFQVLSNILHFLIYNQDGSTVKYSLNTPSDYDNNTLGVWTHLGVSFDPSTGCKIYVDGVSKAVSLVGTLTDIRVQNHQLIIGGLQREGVMDEFKFYKQSFSDSEMLAVYNSEV